MELDEMKRAWAQYDKKLEENLKLNEELLRKMNLDKTRKELQKPLISEIVNMVALLLVILFIGSSTIKYSNELRFSIPGLITTIIAMFGLSTTIMKINKLLNIDYYGSSIISLQKEITTVNKFIVMQRRIEYILIPILSIAMTPIAFKVINNVDLYTRTTLFVTEIVLILGISFPLVLWINKHLYDKKFHNAKRFLEDIERFEKEETID